MKKLLAVLLAAMTCFAFAACGGSSGYGEGEQFQLGDNTYALERVVRATGNDTGATDGYGVSVLQVGNTAPVVISGLGNGTLNSTSAIDMTLHDGDTTYSTRSISFAATDEVEGYGSRVVFYFDIPKGSDLPTSATMKGQSEEEVAELDLSGMTAVEETTTTTTTTTTSVSPENLPVDPNYDPEANKDIGNTDVYDPIDSFDVSLPDTDF